MTCVAGNSEIPRVRVRSDLGSASYKRFKLDNALPVEDKG